MERSDDKEETRKRQIEECARRIRMFFTSSSSDENVHSISLLQDFTRPSVESSSGPLPNSTVEEDTLAMTSSSTTNESGLSLSRGSPEWKDNILFDLSGSDEDVSEHLPTPSLEEPSDEESLPDLIVEVEPEQYKHDEPPEFYERLLAKLRKYLETGVMEDEDITLGEPADAADEVRESSGSIDSETCRRERLPEEFHDVATSPAHDQDVTQDQSDKSPIISRIVSSRRAKRNSVTGHDKDSPILTTDKSQDHIETTPVFETDTSQHNVARSLHKSDESDHNETSAVIDTDMSKSQGHVVITPTIERRKSKNQDETSSVSNRDTILSQDKTLSVLDQEITQEQSKSPSFSRDVSQSQSQPETKFHQEISENQDETSSVKDRDKSSNQAQITPDLNQVMIQRQRRIRSDLEGDMSHNESDISLILRQDKTQYQASPVYEILSGHEAYLPDYSRDVSQNKTQGSSDADRVMTQSDTERTRLSDRDKSKTSLVSDRDKREASLASDRSKGEASLASDLHKSKMSIVSDRDRGEACLVSDRDKSEASLVSYRDKGGACSVSARDKSEASLVSDRDKSKLSLASDRDKSKTSFVSDRSKGEASLVSDRDMSQGEVSPVYESQRSSEVTPTSKQNRELSQTSQVSQVQADVGKSDESSFECGGRILTTQAEVHQTAHINDTDDLDKSPSSEESLGSVEEECEESREVIGHSISDVEEARLDIEQVSGEESPDELDDNNVPERDQDASPEISRAHVVRTRPSFYKDIAYSSDELDLTHLLQSPEHSPTSGPYQTLSIERTSSEEPKNRTTEETSPEIISIIKKHSQTEKSKKRKSTASKFTQTNRPLRELVSQTTQTKRPRQDERPDGEERISHRNVGVQTNSQAIDQHLTLKRKSTAAKSTQTKKSRLERDETSERYDEGMRGDIQDVATQTDKENVHSRQQIFTGTGLRGLNFTANHKIVRTCFSDCCPIARIFIN